jgi:1-deoxyxylulose-5-phosphate synthase
MIMSTPLPVDTDQGVYKRSTAAKRILTRRRRFRDGSKRRRRIRPEGECGWSFGGARSSLGVQDKLGCVNFRALGSSDISVSEISLGSWLTYSGGVEREQARACVEAAFDAGINFIDTANIYGRGASETLLGEVLSGHDRSSYVLATKVFFPMSDTDRGLSSAQIHKQIDASLERLQTDYVDLYQCHRYDDQTPIEETMTALTEVVRAGKARHIGFSEWPVERIDESLALAGVERWVSSQPQYSMIWRAPEAEVIPLCAQEGISQIVWSPLGQGVLTGKYLPGEPLPTDSRAASEEMSGFIDRLLAPPVLEAVQRLRPVAEEAGLTMAQLALAWALREPNVASAIVGASRPEQVHANASASGVELSADTLAAIDTALGDVVVR